MSFQRLQIEEKMRLIYQRASLVDYQVRTSAQELVNDMTLID